MFFVNAVYTCFGIIQIIYYTASVSYNGAVEKGHNMIKTRKMRNFNEASLSDVAGINWEQMPRKAKVRNSIITFIF